MKHLIVGAARSGKSRHAEQLALASGKRLHYIATAEAGDAEMARRIEHHRQRRSKAWHLVEEPIALAQTLRDLDGSDHCLLVDCLTLWLSNCLHAGCWERERPALFEALEDGCADVLLVGNEVGAGIIPMGHLNRRFVDDSGWLHQALGRHCDAVSTVIAGFPVILKEPNP